MHGNETHRRRLQRTPRCPGGHSKDRTELCGRAGPWDAGCGGGEQGPCHPPLPWLGFRSPLEAPRERVTSVVQGGSTSQSHLAPSLGPSDPRSPAPPGPHGQRALGWSHPTYPGFGHSPPAQKDDTGCPRCSQGLPRGCSETSIHRTLYLGSAKQPPAWASPAPGSQTPGTQSRRSWQSRLQPAACKSLHAAREPQQSWGLGGARGPGRTARRTPQGFVFVPGLRWVTDDRPAGRACARAGAPRGQAQCRPEPRSAAGRAVAGTCLVPGAGPSPRLP